MKVLSQMVFWLQRTEGGAFGTRGAFPIFAAVIVEMDAGAGNAAYILQVDL